MWSRLVWIIIALSTIFLLSNAESYATQLRTRTGSNKEIRDSESGDSDQSRVRVLSAGSRRRIKADDGLRKLDDPSMTDAVLNRFDNNDIENELSALANGLEDKRGRKKAKKEYRLRDRSNFQKDKNDYFADDGKPTKEVQEKLNQISKEDIQNQMRRYFGEPVPKKIDTYHQNVVDYSRIGFNELGRSGQFIASSNEGVDLGNPWSEWSVCNVTCGVGQQSKWRPCGDVAELGSCNRATGRQTEWRRCLGMECDRKTIEELGGGCRDHFIMALVLGTLIGIFTSIIATFCYSWCQQPGESWTWGSMCPDCGKCCTGCCGNEQDGCCFGCCRACCDPYYNLQHAHYRHGQFYPHTYTIHPGAHGTVYKRPPAPLPRDTSVRRKQTEEPEYVEIDRSFQSSPRKKNARESVRLKKPAAEYISFDEADNLVSENEYLEIMGDDDEEDDDDEKDEGDYLIPLRKDDKYQKREFDYPRQSSARPR